MSHKHTPPRWWRDEAAEQAAWSEATRYRPTRWRFLVGDGACDCGHPIEQHGTAYFADTPVEEPLPLPCLVRGCECKALRWSGPS